jgi:hypothetical protein
MKDEFFALKIVKIFENHRLKITIFSTIILFTFLLIIIGIAFEVLHYKYTKKQSKTAVLGDETVFTQGMFPLNTDTKLKIQRPTTITAGLDIYGTTNIHGNLQINGQELSTLQSTKETVIEKQPTIMQTTGVSSLQGQTGDLTLAADSGISINGFSIKNTDPGSAQNIFKNIQIGNTTLQASSNNDSIFIDAGNSISIVPDSTNKSITISDTLTQNLTPYTVTFTDGNTTLQSLPAGGSGYLLQSNGSNMPPSWVAANGLTAGNISFSGVTSGTDTNATMLISNGSSLSYSGTGIINATQLLGNNWASPSAIGINTPNTGAFTTLTANTLNNISFSSLNDGFAIAGGIISRTINVTGSNVALNQSLLTTSSPTFADLTLNGNITLGQNNSSFITPNALFNASIVPSDNTINVGSPTNYFGTIYAKNIITPFGQSGQIGLWQYNLGAISPVNSSNDLLLGGTSTASATFSFLNIANGTPTASISGNITLNSSGFIQTSKGQLLTIGGNTTGDIQLKPGNANNSLYLASNGNIGIGTNTPNSPVQLQLPSSTTTPAINLTTTSSNLFDSIFIMFNNRARFGFNNGNIFIDDNGTSKNITFSNNAPGGQVTQRLLINPSGQIGINTSSPVGVMDIRGNGNAALSGTIPVVSISGKTSSAGLVIDNSGVGDLFTASNSGSPKFVIDKNGNTKIFGGSLCVKTNNTLPCGGGVAGNIYASSSTVGSADLAENYTSSQQLEPGDLVIPSSDGDNQSVTKSNTAYQQQLIGVVSTKPGVTLNSDAATDNKHPYLYPIALSGRVPVKVSTENGSINVGDYLTSSSIPGIAMRATKAGTVIGKALESFNGTKEKTSKILAYINISWANPNYTETTFAPFNLPDINTQSSSLSSQFTNLQDQLITQNNATISGTLNVLGNTTVNDLGITGKISAGLLTINGLDTSSSTPSATINTLAAPLKIQSLAINGIEFENGKVTIDTSGNIISSGIISAQEIQAEKYSVKTTKENPSAGKAVIQAGQTEVTITTSALTQNSLIFATPDKLPIPIAKQKLTADKFLLKIDKPLTQSLEIDWWMVN